mmetsp:Transcript_23177/g.50390  ORF Transcript_23177/g.50390 Transcript_23177/m.50390 type:complete len:269 (+) Transcript_23177:1-807(+)
MQQLMEEERAELEEDAADPVDIVPAHEDDEESSPDKKTKREKKAEEEEKKKNKKKKSKKRKLSADNAAAEDGVSRAAREGDKEETGADNSDDGIGKPLSKKQRKKLAKQKAKELADAVAKEQGYDKKRQQEKDDAAATNKVEKKRSAPSKSMTRERRIEGGVIVRDIVIGTGTSVRPGRKVSINYEGTLQSDGSVFDKNKSKANPFSFRPGTGEVIKGLDKGMEGMKIGGERIITIPPAMAYGRKGTAGIPKNSTLIFAIKLLNIGGM